jgi:type IV secretion system protein VirB11
MHDRDVLLAYAGDVLPAYLNDPDITEVLCNSNGTCFVNRFGIGMQEITHPGLLPLETFLLALAHEVGADFRHSAATLSLALDDLGWRIEAGRPPLAPAAYCAIRKHPRQLYPLAQCVEQGILRQGQAAYLVQAVRAGKRVFLTGEVGSGKTSILNALLDTLTTTTKRVVVIEDTPEILCTIRNCTRMYLDSAQLSLRQAVKNALRLFPDLLVIGEVRDGAALDMLKAFQTGHSGLTTLHVGDPWQACARLEQLVSEVSVSPQSVLIGECVDVIVHMARRAHRPTCATILECQGYTAPQGYLLHEVSVCD